MDGKSSNQDLPEIELERIDLELLAIGKKAGLSFEEISMLRVRDLIKFVSIFAGTDEDKSVKQAGQEDFDSF